jgi:prepilin-type N-terminal cleavage/methylation domain-containing protein
LNKQKGFTLIELLVVIAIIALLMAILMPVLRKAKEQGKYLRCAGNQRQVILGLTAYAADNDEKLPPNTCRFQGANFTAFHQPHELNFHYSNSFGKFNPADPKYHYVGKYVGSYLPQVYIYNCPASPIDPEIPWPPPASQFGQPVDSYENLYLSGEYAPLNCTYLLFWNYQGYNKQFNQSGVHGRHSIEGPKKLSGKTQLLIQDSLFCGGWVENPVDDHPWHSSHGARNSVRAERTPFYNTPYLTDTEYLSVEPEDAPEMKMQAGFTDGHVESFNSKNDSITAGCASHKSIITKMCRYSTER